MMWAYVAATFIVIGFACLLHVFGVLSRVRKVLVVARGAFAQLRDPDLDDDSKEAALQAHSLQLAKASVIITAYSAAALILSVLPIWVCERLGIISLHSVTQAALSWQFILASSVVMFVGFKVVSMQSVESHYSSMERLFHHVAFHSTTSQVALADFEEHVFAKDLQGLTAAKPVFITALPRAGTTLLLNILAALDEFATHTYRDMPFILTPLIWNRVSERFQRNDGLQERAHGDGVLVNADSPEAFEEVLWQAFWRRQYHNDRILPWKEEASAEFRDFFRGHMRKIMALRGNGITAGVRYISKNNNNIARLRLLTSLFADARVLVPFRNPMQHAASLLRQHQNFLKIHARDRFARNYMKAIGHYDFGLNLRPIDFDGWLDSSTSLDPDRLSFWVKYWVAAYRCICAVEDSRVFMLSYDALLATPKKVLARIADVVEVEDREALLRRAELIRQPKPHDINGNDVPPDIRDEAEAIFAELRSQSLI